MFVRQHCFKFLIVAFTLASPNGVLAQAQTGERSTATTVGAASPVETVSAKAPSAAPADNSPVVAAPAAETPEPPQETLPPNVQEARRRFDRGIRLYGEGDFGLALIEFERAYELVANYRVLYNIGQVSIQLRRYAKAREALEQYLTQGGAEVEGARLEEVQADIDMLRPRTAKLLVTTNAPKAKVSLDGDTLGTLPLANALLVDAGNHVVKVEASGYQVSEKPVVLAGGDEVTLAITLEVIRQGRTVEKRTIVVHDGANADNTWKWVGWGATGVLAAGAVTTGIFGLNSAAKLEDLINTAGVSHEELSSEQSRAKRMFLASDILAAGAVAAAAVSLYLTIGGDDTTEQPGKIAIKVSPNAVTVRSVF
jgi:hypothetical protein